jgi:hypothetical protein
MIEAMFGGRFGSPAIMDDSGAYFLDRDPEYFAYVLSYLRDPRNRPNPSPHHSRLAVLREFEYFGLLSDAGAYIAEPESQITCKRHLELTSRFSSLSVHGSRAYISTETHVELWCLDTQECKAKMEISAGSLVRAIEATSSRVFILCDDSEIQVWDAMLVNRIRTVNPGTGFASHFQMIHNANYTSPNPMLWNLDQGNSEHYGSDAAMQPTFDMAVNGIGFNKRIAISRETRFPAWKSRGARGKMRSTLFFDGDVGVFSMDMDTFTISKVVEVADSESLSAFHVSGEELYYATSSYLMAFNLRTHRSVKLTAIPGISVSRLRVSQDGLLYIWDVLKLSRLFYDLKQRDWTELSEPYEALAECEVAGSIVVGRVEDKIVLWCSSPLLNLSNHGMTSTGFAAQSMLRQRLYPSARSIPVPNVVRLMSSPGRGTSWFFSFQGSSIIVAQTSPQQVVDGGEENTSSSIRVFQIER